MNCSNYPESTALANIVQLTGMPFVKPGFRRGVLAHHAGRASIHGRVHSFSAYWGRPNGGACTMRIKYRLAACGRDNNFNRAGSLG